MIKQKPISILLWSSNLWYLGEGLLGPLFAVFAERIGGNILDLTWAWGVYLIVCGVNIIVVGKLSDGFMDKRRLLLIGYVLNTLFTFGYIIVNNQISLFLVQIGLGMATALATPTWQALYADYGKNEKSGMVWGLFSGEAKLVTGVAIILGGLIVTEYSFKLLFVVMGLVQLFASLYLLQLFGLKSKPSQ